MQLKNTEYPDNGADVLVELGRYEESIDRRIKYFSEDQYYMAKYARIIAQKHAPHRQDEIAKLVVKH
ncbi:TPA: hypothetical protein DCZ39_01150 [Patescibacteria group bacterium]|nr:hypothetical protein [Candidatus Gracilibacteria bacterium]